MLIREESNQDPYKALTKNEMEVLDRVTPDKVYKKNKSLEDYLYKLARLDGYLVPKSGLPPGHRVIWRGLKKIIEMQRGFENAEILVVN